MSVLQTLDQRQLGQHVKILGWLNIATSAFLLVIGAFVWFLLTGIGAISGDAEAVAVLGFIGIAVAALMAAFALPGLAAGYGLLKRQSWGRVLALAVGFINLMNAPLGTILGLYTFWVLLQEGAPAYFDEHPALPREPQPDRPEGPPARPMAEG